MLTAGLELYLLQFNFLVTHGYTKFVNAGKLVHIGLPSYIRVPKVGMDYRIARRERPSPD